MHTITRGVVSVALAVVSIVGVAGCSSTESAPAASGSTAATPTPTATAASAGIDFGDAPDTTGVPRCADLLPTDLVGALVPGTQPVDTLVATRHIGGSESFAVLAGGTFCQSTNGVAVLDDVLPGTASDPAYEGVRVTVLPDAGADFADAAGRSETPETAATVTSCGASDAARVFCHGGVLAGTAWVDISSVRLQSAADATPEAARPAFDALLDAVAATVASSPLGSASPSHDAPDWTPTTCDSANVNAVASTRLDDPRTLGSGVSAQIEQYAMNRVDGAECIFQGAGSGQYPYPVNGGLYSEAPGAGWFVEQRLGAGTIDRGDRLELDGLGDADGAWRTCDDTACSVDVVRDGDWSHYLLFAEVAPNTSTAVERWVEASIGA